jgi:DNA-binding LacI/PurR family transcriptional regulator
VARSHPTIIDVANAAGVSKSLVSLVLRGAPNVSSERRKAVLQAAEDLGYRPNAVARSLVRQRSYLIGVMLSDLRNPYFTEVVEGIEEEAIAAGYRALITTGSRLPAREAVALDALLQLRVDGLILAGPVLDSSTIVSAGRSAAVVLVARSTRSRHLDSVSNDDKAGAAMAVHHLVQLGHRRISHIDGGVGAGSSSRRAGYLAEMRRHGLADGIEVIPGDYTENGGASGVDTLLRRPAIPTALFVANDQAAVGALHALEAAGLQVPGDVSLVGYDNTAVAGLGHIGLTTINQPRREMGELAVRLLMERVEQARHDPSHLVIAPSLVVRRTTAPPRASNPQPKVVAGV